MQLGPFAVINHWTNFEMIGGKTLTLRGLCLYLSRVFMDFKFCTWFNAGISERKKGNWEK
jgi:hypothetical protein